MAAVLIFIVGTMMACIASGRWLLGGEVNIINALASFTSTDTQTGGVWSFIQASPLFIRGIITALAWNYPFLASPWAIFIKIPLWIISIGCIWGLISAAITVASGLTGVIRGIFH